MDACILKSSSALTLCRVIEEKKNFSSNSRISMKFGFSSQWGTFDVGKNQGKVTKKPVVGTGLFINY